MQLETLKLFKSQRRYRSRSGERPKIFWIRRMPERYFFVATVEKYFTKGWKALARSRANKMYVSKRLIWLQSSFWSFRMIGQSGWSSMEELISAANIRQPGWTNRVYKMDQGCWSRSNAQSFTPAMLLCLVSTRGVSRSLLNLLVLWNCSAPEVWKHFCQETHGWPWYCFCRTTLRPICRCSFIFHLPASVR